MSIRRTIWQFWTGDNDITPGRKTVLASNANIPVETRLLMPDDIMKMQLPDHPYHRAYQYLSYTHRADYLRCYFMHFYGGGYADIKEYSKDNNWKECFDLVDSDERIFVVGQKEHIGGSPIRQYNVDGVIEKLVSNGYFIMRPQTEFTQRWMDMVNDKLDGNIEQLKRCWPQTRMNPQIQRGTNPSYPFRWAEILGEILHSLEYEYRDSGYISTALVSGRLRTQYR